MNKNSFKEAITKTNIAFFLLMVMLVSFFASRAVLSMSMILFGVNALWNVHPKKWLRQKWWLLGCLWITLFALSFFWSDDKSYWLEHVQVKLPILLLPLSFAFIPAFSKKQLYIYTIVLCTCLLWGIGYSFYFLALNPTHYIDGYAFSNILPTIPKNEHIRFTLTLAIGIIWLFYFFPIINNRFAKALIGIIMFLFIVALHIYAVRTGLMAFYLFITCYLFYLFLKKETKKKAVIFTLALIIGSILSFQYIPTLKNRVAHFKWSVKMFEEGNNDPNYGDIGRYISYDLGWEIIKEHPLTGVGAGDMFTEMDAAYQTYYPQVDEKLRLLPHNQFMIIALASGLLNMIIFIAWAFYPLAEIKKNRDGFFFFITWLVVTVSLLVEPVLEIQFGIFVYLFFLLIQRHIMLKNNYNSK